MAKHEHYENGRGPLYSVPLIDVLPLNPEKPEGTLQQMPSAEDLKRSRQRGDRVCAGYEVLLHHWRLRGGEIERLKEELAKLRDNVSYWSYCMSQGMRAECPEKVQELADFLIGLKIAPYYVRNSCCETVRVARSDGELSP
jgi:hypothetical protein